MSQAEYADDIDFKDVVKPETEESENPDKPTETNKESITNEDVPDVDPVVEQATSQGWVPKQEWEGNPDDWVDARQFVQRGELMSRISSQTKHIKQQDKQLKKLTAAMKELGEHNTKIAEVEYQKAMDTLKAQKVQALEEQEHSAVMQIDEQIDQLKEAKRQADEDPTVLDELVQEEIANEEEGGYVSQEDKIHPYMQEWVKENEWYSKDPFLHTQADMLYVQYMRMNPDVEETEAIDYVGEQIRENFPHKFENPRRKASSALSSSRSTRRATKARSKYTKADLSEDQMKFGTTFVESGAFSNIQEYVDQLAETGEIPAQKGE